MLTAKHRQSPNHTTTSGEVVVPSNHFSCIQVTYGAHASAYRYCSPTNQFPRRRRLDTTLRVHNLWKDLQPSLLSAQPLKLPHPHYVIHKWHNHEQHEHGDSEHPLPYMRGDADPLGQV